jgi:spore coat protein CotH
MMKMNTKPNSRLGSSAALFAVLGLCLSGCALDDDPQYPTPVFFDQSRLHEVRLTMDPADWSTLKEQFNRPFYYAADLSIDGETLRHVGIRSRGFASRRPEKPCLRVDMNRFVEWQDFYGYNSLVIDNQYRDPTLLRERLAFMVFEAMGIAAPRMAHARLWINDEYGGLYTITEPVDRVFLRTRLGDDDGNLFDCNKVGWDFTWRGSDWWAYIPDYLMIETNTRHFDPTALIEFVRTANQSPDVTFVEDLSAFIDPKHFLTYIATENALAERDGFVGDAKMANFYLYQYAGTTRFVLIPWDKDSCLLLGKWAPFFNMRENVLTRRLMELPEQKAFYASTLIRIVNEYVNARWLVPRLDEAYHQIRDAALEDPFKPASNDEFEAAVAALRRYVANREGDVLRRLDVSAEPSGTSNASLRSSGTP